MAFIVEDGTGLDTSTAYVDVSFVDDFFSDRNNSIWAALTVAQKQAAIIESTAYVDVKYGSKFIGKRKKNSQNLEWPRDQLDNSPFDESISKNINLIPDKLKYAISEYSLLASQSPLAPNAVYDETNRIITSKSEKVGPIEQSVTFSDRVVSTIVFRSYPLADNYLNELLVNGGGRGGALLRA